MPVYPIISNPEAVSSPGLWLDRLALKRNIDQMVSDVGGPAHLKRLRPHVKTHKMREVVALQVSSGITKCKASTPSEAKMAAEGGATDILIAHQLVGPKIQQVRGLIDNFPEVHFSVITDNNEALSSLTSELASPGRPLTVWIDDDCGMHRSGIEFGPELDALRETIEGHKSLKFGGLHVYDGHLHAPSLEDRTAAAGQIISAIRDYHSSKGSTPVVGGGSPTFGIWATETDWECSPGTTLLWDCGYGDKFPDLRYEVAAGLITRVISKPGINRLCLDLGHKSVAAEMALPLRAIFPEIPNAVISSQSEEHLVIEVPDSSIYHIGDTFTAIPRHICPTVALHAYAAIVENGKPTGETWKVVARDRL